MRAVALGLATLLATMSAGWAQDEDSALCSTAQRASAGTLPAVVQACNQALQAQSTAAGQAKMLRYRGIALARGGNLPAAVADFDQVLQTTPDDTAALQGRAQTYEALGQRAQAAADYGRLAALRPGDTRWRIKVAALGGAAAPPSAAAVRAPAAAPAPPTQLVRAQPTAAPNVQTAKYKIAKADYQMGNANRLTGRWIQFHNDAPYNSGGAPGPSPTLPHHPRRRFQDLFR